MKHKIIYILFVLIALAGCSDSTEYNPNKYAPSLKAKYLSLSEKEFDLPDAGTHIRNFTVTSMGTPWGFTEVMDWVALSKTQSTNTETVSLTVDENLSGDSNRLGVFYLESKDKEWKYKAPVSVFQPAAIPYAYPDINELTFSGASTNQEVWVTSNCTWECSTDVNWLTAVKNEDSNSIYISVSENLSDMSRGGYVYLTFNGETLTWISIVQRAAEVSMQSNTLNFDNTAGAYELKLVSEVSWTASTSHTWINVSPDSGEAGESTLRISALENTTISDRTGYVYIKTGNSNRVEIPVRQRGLYIEFQVSNLEFEAEGGEQTIVITSNTSWEIVLPTVTTESWITVSPMSGELDREITISLAENPNLTSRSITITATQTGLSLKDDLVITQKGKYFNYGSVSTFECSDKAQDLVVDVKSDAAWQAVSNDSWISVSPESMTGDAELVISVEENNTDGSRTGTVTLTIGDQSYTLTVIQSGKYFTIEYSDSQFTSKGTTLSIDVITNDSWTAKVEGQPSWITLSRTCGEGNASVVATIADNPSVNSRTATIIIETPHEQSLKIPVSQAARYMTVDCQSVQFFAGGGTSQDITIKTDAEYSVTCSDTWFYVTEKGNGIFNVTAEQNTTKQLREGVVTIAMTDLQEGTYSIDMSVIQAADGATFNVIGYGDDNDFDLGSSETVSLTVIGYGEEKNWDNSSSENGLVVNVTGYVEDKNYDSESSQSSGSISNEGYGGDNDYDSGAGTSFGSVSFDGYSSDNNWN